MEHGDQRNRREETTTQYATWNIDGQSIEVPVASMTKTVSERFCETCRRWVNSSGIIGALLCQTCNTPWKRESNQ